MTTTPYGYQNPSTGDASKGASGWMAQINFDILRLDTHTHNGVDSALLSLASLATPTVTASNVDWVVDGSGFSQLVTVPAGVGDINSFSVRFVSALGGTIGEAIYLPFIRITATTFQLYSNDNTIDVLCIFR